jgi:hypothetical protein
MYPTSSMLLAPFMGGTMLTTLRILTALIHLRTWQQLDRGEVKPWLNANG